MKRNIIFIGGINGSGKTTIAQKLSEKTQIPFFEGSATLMSKLNLKRDDYEKLRALPQEVKQKANLEVFQEVSENNDRAIMTSHFIMMAGDLKSVDLQERYEYCLLLVHLTSRPDKILERIESTERNRSFLFKKETSREGKLGFIAQAQEKSLEVARKIAEARNIQLVIVENEDIDQSVEEVLSLHHYSLIERIIEKGATYRGKDY